MRGNMQDNSKNVIRSIRCHSNAIAHTVDDALQAVTSPEEYLAISLAALAMLRQDYDNLRQLAFVRMRLKYLLPSAGHPNGAGIRQT
jgi:hypothetical protein